MGSKRLVGVFVALLCAPLCLSQETRRQPADVKTETSTEVGGSAPENVRPEKLPKRGPEIFYCETPDTTCRTSQDSFPLALLRDLYVFVVWPSVHGQHVQTVEFYLPDGNIYFSKKTRFTIGGAPLAAVLAPAARKDVSPPAPAPQLIADANKIHPEGIPSLLTKSRDDSGVLTVLPVGGTYITQRNLGGTWRVRVWLDDRPALESVFTLTPRVARAHPEGAEQ
jgi:hypothetical protein